MIKEGTEAGIDALKRDVFFRLMDLAGRVFVLVRHSPDVRIGNRGFLPHEVEEGLVLVFSGARNLIWDESGIHATLTFSSRPEKCFIPPSSMAIIYSPELGAQFVISADDLQAEEPESREEETDEVEAPSSGESNLITVDFTRKK